ncbi:MAG: succinate dehydrogenase cytochrome b subunit [Bacteroidetes bacterium]|nr:succinate dehydrogenase cytochrome b subunit [Bacteroidota bacterium]
MAINTKSSIGRKVLMSLSALFLLFFLFQHFLINVTSVFSPDLFNELSHFMGTNPLVQFALQPVLIFGVVFHFVMGFVLEIQNKKARGVNYASYNGGANASWASRNMLISGAVILAFLGLHFYDFWIPEIAHKYIHFAPEDPNRYFGELQHKFTDIIRVVLYSLSFVLLALHLNHGFQSAFQSVGFNDKKYTPALKKIGKWYSILIPLGFVFIAIFHYINQL